MDSAGIKSLHEHVVALAKKHPSRLALLDCDQEGKISREISFKELAEEIESAASYLSVLGLGKGDRVALAFKNSIELLIISWAAWSSGIITIPLDTKRDTAEQHAYKIKLNGAKCLIAQKDALKDAVEHFHGVKIVEFSDLGKGTHAKIEWETGLSHQALVLFTSGTTAHPKGAKLSLKNLIVNAESIREWLRITDKDRFLVNLPLHHINSTTFCLSTLLAGGSIAIVPSYSNSHFWQQVAATSATITSIVQSILFDQLNREEEYAAVRKNVVLSRIQIGSAPVIASTVQEFRKKFGIPLFQGYGQTETALRVTGVPMGLPENLYEKLVEENSIGAPMAWADVRIAGEDGKFLGEGEEGEIVVKGEALMEEYVGGEPAFREDGYFLTGDVGFFRVAEGKQFFYLKGRKKEIIIKGGINISPIAVENSLKKISYDIAQVHIVAVADERYGEETGAVISWKEGVDAEVAKRRLKLALLCGTQYLSAYETPKYITSMPVSELPTTSTGKVQRTILKQQLPYERFESIYGLFRTPEYRFTVLHRYSRWVRGSYELYNHCWEPLMAEKSVYEKNIPKQVIILAADKAEHIAGQIALIRTDLSGDELLRVKYDELLTPKVLSPQGKNIVCISICSADYKPKPVPDVSKIPSEKEVLAYVPQDPVFKFHRKPKAGLLEGAHFVGLIPNGRPEDKSSLGYNMLLQYPEPKGDVRIHDDVPVSQRLIEAVLVLARDVGIENVYAYSRPGGMASYIAHQE